MEPCRRIRRPGTRSCGATSEEKAAPVRMVRTLRAELGAEHGTVQRVATQLGYGVESVRQWVEQADINEGHSGVSRRGSNVGLAGELMEDSRGVR